MTSHQALRDVAKPTPAPPAASNLDPIDERMREEMKLLAAANRDLLERAQTEAPIEKPEEVGELAVLRAENAELRGRVEELENFLVAAAKGEGIWADQQKEYEALVEEKSEVIRALHLKLQELQEAKPPQGAKGPGNQACPDQDTLKQRLDEQRRQLQADEEALMAQMRQMEMAMSKERAEIARQRTELTRLQTEVNREIDLASRDPSLRERLLSLQRRQPAASKAAQSKAQTEGQTPAAPPASVPRTNSGILRRIFGK